jgi:hypothetical protein
LLLCLFADVARAETTPQDCGSGYGCVNQAPPSSPSECSNSSSSASPGDQLFATIRNVPVGTKVTLTFDGAVVGEAITTADGSGEQAFAALPAAGHLSARQSTMGGAIVHWTVPADAGPGAHALVFSGVGVNCNAAVQGVQVLSFSAVRPSGGAPLARTGTRIALLLAVAVVLLIAGTQLTRAARRRRGEREPVRQFERLTR